jgi:hypothetical protein
VILSGNVAFPLYGAILAAATLGWRRNRWFPYYIAVLVASVFKTPFLVLLAFPVLIDRRQRIPSGLTAGTGVLLFAAQMRVCPVLFREYLSSLRLVFDWLRDFGYGPAGTLGKALESLGLQSMFATTIVHLAFAGAMAIVLFSLARHVRRENLPQQTWIPLALVGTFLLNPRLMKYDMAAITIPMLLIAWRGFRFAFQGSAPENPGHGWKATDFRLCRSFPGTESDDHLWPRLVAGRAVNDAGSFRDRSLVAPATTGRGSAANPLDW